MFRKKIKTYGIENMPFQDRSKTCLFRTGHIQLNLLSGPSNIYICILYINKMQFYMTRLSTKSKKKTPYETEPEPETKLLCTGPITVSTIAPNLDTPGIRGGGWLVALAHFVAGRHCRCGREPCGCSGG